jgi:tetratricopeptide (TPR) repeat protein
LKLDASSAEALDTKGFIFYKLGKFKEALELFEKSILINSASSDVWNHKGEVLLKLSRKTEAMESFIEAKKLNNALYTEYH